MDYSLDAVVGGCLVFIWAFARSWCASHVVAKLYNLQTFQQLFQILTYKKKLILSKRKKKLQRKVYPIKKKRLLKLA